MNKVLSFFRASPFRAGVILSLFYLISIFIFSCVIKDTESFEFSLVCIFMLMTFALPYNAVLKNNSFKDYAVCLKCFMFGMFITMSFIGLTISLIEFFSLNEFIELFCFSLFIAFLFKIIIFLLIIAVPLFISGVIYNFLFKHKIILSMILNLILVLITVLFFSVFYIRLEFDYDENIKSNAFTIVIKRLELCDDKSFVQATDDPAIFITEDYDVDDLFSYIEETYQAEEDIDGVTPWEFKNDNTYMRLSPTPCYILGECVIWEMYSTPKRT